MIIKFQGFKNPPLRNHVIVSVNGQYKKVNIGETIDTDEKTCYELMSDKGQLWVQARQRQATEVAPAAENRAILDGKAV